MTKQKEVDIRAVVRAYIAKTYGTQAAAARHWNVAPSYVSAVLSGDKMMPEYMANEAGYKLIGRVAQWSKL